MSIEQRTNLKFLIRLDKTPSEALALQPQVYGKNAMSRSRGFEWHRKFKKGHENLEDDA